MTLAAAVLASAAPTLAQEPPAAALTTEQAQEENACAAGLQAFLWGYLLRSCGTVTPESLKAGGVYLNDFREFRALKTRRTASSSPRTTSPPTPMGLRRDRRSGSDLRAELTEDRWYIVQIGDHFDEIIHNVGGTKGQQPGVYVITGPDFTGTLPARGPKPPRAHDRLGAWNVECPLPA